MRPGKAPDEFVPAADPLERRARSGEIDRSRRVAHPGTRSAAATNDSRRRTGLEDGRCSVSEAPARHAVPQQPDESERIPVPRTMGPHEALAVCFPTVADTWHQHRNGDRTPHNTSGKNAYQAWWRCGAGHEWQESVSGRTNKPRWKRGDVAACRVCVGYHVIVAFDCGHTTEARAEFAEPERGCPACRKLRWAQRQADYAEQAHRGRAAFRLTEQAGRKLLDSLTAPDLPAPMLFEWRRTTLNELRRAIVRRDVYGVEDAIDTTSAACLAMAAQLMPSAESLTAARSRLEPIKLAGKAHWPAGWLYYLGHATRAPEPRRPADDALVADLTRHLSEQVRRCGKRSKMAASPPRTSPVGSPQSSGPGLARHRARHVLGGDRIGSWRCR
jgi:hypothetical protein